MHLIINTDGASRGNPGPAAIGIVIKNDKNEVVGQVSRRIGFTTNNVAEYIAVITALKEVLKLQADEISLFVDSELLCRQLTGRYQVKSVALRPYYFEIINIIKKLKSFEVNHIRREYNCEADQLANEAFESI
jgi:ribonuclease HI